MPSYQWWTLNQAIAALQGRLQNSTYWTVGELTLWIQDALRAWNALTETWRQNYVLTPSSLWNNLGTLTGNPRFRTVTNFDLYTRMQYMLLENPTGGGAWTGTNQFDLSSMQYALDKRRNEVIQVAGCNLDVLTVPTVPNTRTAGFPDSVLEPVRARFIPTSGFGDPVLLSREDAESFFFWEPDYNQTFGSPSAWDVITQPVLSLYVDTAPTFPGSYEVVVIQSGPSFDSSDASLLGLPDDWSFLPMFGALADLLESEPTRTDTARANYCKQRYIQGLEIIRKANWMVDAKGENGPSDILSLDRADQYMTGWDTAGYLSRFTDTVVAGMDFLSCPFDSGVNLSLVGNMPFPSNGGDYLQVSRDVAAVIIDYAQHLALFKQGGDYFEATMPLYKGFLKAAAETNKRLSDLGIYADIVREEGRVQELDVARG